MISRHLLLAVVFGIFESVSCYAEKSIDVKVDIVLSLIENLGPITTRTVDDRPNTGGKLINVKAAHGSVQMEFDKSGELTSISRQSDKPDEPLKWEEKQAAAKAAVYISKLANPEDMGDPVLITQENVNGLRNLWYVGWARRIKGYKVRDDFVAVTFNENDGLFGFARSWATPGALRIPARTLEKTDAIKLGQSAAKQVMQKFGDRFSGYRLGKVVLEDLVIVAPNNVLNREVKTEGDLLNGDTKNPRLVWTIGFKIEVDPTTKEATISETSGLAVWIDAETGSCIGAEF